MHKTLPLAFTLLLALAAAFMANASSPAETSWFIDVHEVGPGKVTAADVAKAHQADLATQQKHGVHFVDYWVDEERGRIYCLSEAKDAPSIVATHREAHGLLPSRILPVTSGSAVRPTGAGHLFLDTHELGAGNVTAQAVAAAHEKDLAVQSQHAVRFLNYWVDEVSGQVLCLSEAPNANAVRDTHAQAHGLLPAEIVEVKAAE